MVDKYFLIEVWIREVSIWILSEILCTVVIKSCIENFLKLVFKKRNFNFEDKTNIISCAWQEIIIWKKKYKQR